MRLIPTLTMLLVFTAFGAKALNTSVPDHGSVIGLQHQENGTVSQHTFTTFDNGSLHCIKYHVISEEMRTEVKKLEQLCDKMEQDLKQMSILRIKMRILQVKVISGQCRAEDVVESGKMIGRGVLAVQGMNSQTEDLKNLMLRIEALKINSTAEFKACRLWKER